MTNAIDIKDGHGPKKNVHRQLQPKKTKVQYNLYNPMLHGKAKMYQITEIVRLLNCLHNSTLTITLDSTVKVYNTTLYMLDCMDRKQYFT